MRLRPLGAAAIIGLLLGLALVLNSCGEDRTSAANRPPTATTTAPDPKPAPKRAPAPRNSCRTQLGAFIGSMAALRRNLARGLNYEEYLRAVQNVRRAYHDVRPKELNTACLLYSAGPAEHALNLYIDAANDWGNCLATPGCTTTTVEPKLQQKWALASEKLSQAQRASRR